MINNAVEQVIYRIFMSGKCRSLKE